MGSTVGHIGTKQGEASSATGKAAQKESGRLRACLLLHSLWVAWILNKTICSRNWVTARTSFMRAALGLCLGFLLWHHSQTMQFNDGFLQKIASNCFRILTPGIWRSWWKILRSSVPLIGMLSVFHQKALAIGVLTSLFGWSVLVCLLLWLSSPQLLGHKIVI